MPMGPKHASKNRKTDYMVTNIGASLERIKKMRALHCDPGYIGIDTLVLRMLPFSRPSSLY